MKRRILVEITYEYQDRLEPHIMNLLGIMNSVQNNPALRASTKLDVILTTVRAFEEIGINVKLHSE